VTQARPQGRAWAGLPWADDLPHGAAAARVQAGGRLVEEDDARVTDQGHRGSLSPLAGRLLLKPTYRGSGVPPTFAELTPAA
jgi:hypothetical protein